MALKSARASSLLPSDHSTLIHRDRFKHGFTQSEITTWDDCKEKWYLGYNHQLHLRGSWADYFVYGDALHSTLSRWYTDGTEKVSEFVLPFDVRLTQDEAADLAKWQAILRVQMERYFHYYQDDLSVFEIMLNEEALEYTHQGILLKAKIDLFFSILGQVGNIVSDHKSSSREESYSFAGYQFRFQFMFYFWLVEKATGEKVDKFLVNHIKKPQLKQGKNESLESFIARVKQDMIQVPEKYFQRTWLPMIEDAMVHFEQRVLQPKLDRIHLLTQDTTPANIVEVIARDQNTGACTQYGHCCPFMRICQNGFKKEAFQYVAREHKHEELQPCKP